MLIIQRQATDPFFNTAAEEFLLKHFTEDVFSLWINEPCIVVGKHQNTLAEVNYPFVKQTGIPVVRRITGGGTVYQDEGNLNFSFITTGEPEKLVNFTKHTRPVIDFLYTLGIRAQLKDKSSLVIDGKKFSGNSAHVHKNRVIHHGTLLYSSNLELLHRAITREQSIYTDNSVKSNRAEVCNISGYLRKNMPIHDFAAEFSHFIMNNFPGCSIYNLSKEQEHGIENLADEKYRQYNWNFGYNHDYNIDNEIDDGERKYKISIKVVKGLIVYSSFRFLPDGPDFIPGDLLFALPHQEAIIRKKLEDLNLAGNLKHFSIDEIINQIF